MSNEKMMEFLSNLFSSFLAATLLLFIVFYGLGIFLGAVFYLPGLNSVTDVSPIRLIFDNPVASLSLWLVFAVFFYLLNLRLTRRTSKEMGLMPFVNTICFVLNFFIAEICVLLLFAFMNTASIGGGPSAGYAMMCIYFPLGILIFAILFLRLYAFELRLIRKFLNTRQADSDEKSKRKDNL